MRAFLFIAIVMLAGPAAAASHPDADDPSSKAGAAEPVTAFPVEREDYPPESVAAGEEGRVHVRYLVSVDGSVGVVTIMESSGSPRLDQAAIPIVMRWQFTPAMQGGKPVPAWQDAIVVFKLH